MPSSKAERSAPASASRLLRNLAFTAAKIGAPLFLLGLIYAVRNGQGMPEALFFTRQDAAILVLTPMLILALSVWRLRLVPEQRLDALLERRTIWLAALAVAAIGFAGVWLVFENYVLSLDEFMANFDAEIFRSGHLMAKVPAQWLAFSKAMTPLFTLDTKDDAYWASAYLPVNAFLRAGGAILHIQPLVNPLLAAVALIMTWAVGRQLWPEHPRRAAAAALLLATSAQFLVMSMTAYAMTAHLAFNMIWLWLFLKNRRWADALAILVGAAACGLHQVVFHPFFVGPFILELLIARRWARAATFIGAYVVIGVFWLSYWVLIYRITGAAPLTATAAGGSYFVHQFLTFVANFQTGNFGLMALNLVRFVTWQNLIYVPLAIAGGLVALRRGGPLRAAAIGMALVPAVLTVVLPTQIHGWGYRYLHGFLGVGSLLAVFGWTELTRPLAPSERATANQAMVGLSLISLLILVPLRAYQAWSFSHPLARVHQVIVSRPEDIVLVDNGTIGFDQGSMTRNDPFLRNRPKVMLLSYLDTDDLDELCRRGRVWVFDGRNPAMKGVITFESRIRGDVAPLRDHLRQIGCAS